MRTVKYLSPTSLQLYETDSYQFFYNYLADTRLERDPQTQPMSVGSSFDAFVKHNLYVDLFGKADEQFELNTLFETQVEEQNRDFALDAGKYLFDCYTKVGAYKELLDDIQKGSNPRFEFLVEKDIGGVNLLGKPDCLYIRHNGDKVLLDFKVNGYCSKSTTSPAKNYQMVRDAWDETVAKPTRNTGKAHKNYKPVMVGDYEIGELPFEDGCGKWSAQLAIYAWVLGEPIGTDVIVAVDQLACKPGVDKPLVRIAQHRGRLSHAYQTTLYARLQEAWNNIQDGYIFTKMSREENDRELELLNKSATLMESNDLFKSLRF